MAPLAEALSTSVPGNCQDLSVSLMKNPDLCLKQSTCTDRECPASACPRESCTQRLPQASYC